MFDYASSVRGAVEEMARSCDAGAFTGSEAAQMLGVLGEIQRMVDGMVARFAKRLADTSEHVRRGERSAATEMPRRTPQAEGASPRPRAKRGRGDPRESAAPSPREKPRAGGRARPYRRPTPVAGCESTKGSG